MNDGFIGTAHINVDAVEAESGEGPFNGGALGIGDSGPEGDLDADGEPHALAPYQSARAFPEIRS